MQFSPARAMFPNFNKVHATSSQNSVMSSYSTPRCFGVNLPFSASLNQVFSTYLQLCLHVSSTWYSFFYKTLLHSLRPTESSNSCLKCPPILLLPPRSWTHIAHSFLHLPLYIITSTYGSSLPSIIQFLGFCSTS